jgi:signal transduction histidine kinase
VGLAICRELAQRIDAEISLESSDSAGSCFLVRMVTMNK